MTNGEIGLNSLRKPLSFALPNTIAFGFECNMSCMQSILITHFLYENKSPCSLQLIELHKMHFMIMQMTCMLLSLFATSDPVGGLLLCPSHDKKGE